MNIDRLFAAAKGLGLCALLGLSATAATAEPLRIGYWSSGMSLGFGTYLQQGGFFEALGFEVEYVTFPDVNAPTKAMAGGSIDFAIAASAGSALSVTADGLPMSVILATQVADLKYVVPMDSPIQSIADLKGKKIGSSPAGSATSSMSAAILERNYGLTAADYEAVPGNDSRLAQFMVQGDIDAAALRTVSLELVDTEFRELGSFRSEWAKIAGGDSFPVLGAGMIADSYLAQDPDAAPRIVTAMMDALTAGSADKAGVAKALVEAANISQENAEAYAALWDQIYTVVMDDSTVASFQTEFDVFKSVGKVQGDFAAHKFLTGPYEAAMASN